MNKKLTIFKTKFILLFLFILTVVFYLLGYLSLASTDYKISNYISNFNLSNSFFEITKYFDFNLDFNFNDYRSSNYYDLREDITELNFNFTSQHIEVRQYSGDTLNIDIDSDSSDEVELSLNKTDTKLFFNTKYNTPSNAKILINIPQGFCTKGSIVISTSSGNVSFDKFQNRSLKINTANGNINLSDCTTSYLYLTSTSGSILADNLYTSIESRIISNTGKIKLSGFLGTLTLSNTSGLTNISFSDLNKYNNISTNTGNIKLNLPENLGYKINYISSTGIYKSEPELLYFGDQSYEINIKTLTGNLSVSR